MSIKTRIWNIGRAAFRMLPISVATKTRWRDGLLALAGGRAAALPPYQESRQRDAPNAFRATREEIWEQFYAGDTRPTFLLVSHDMGGGTEQHVLFLKDKLAQEGIRCLALRHGEPKSSTVILHDFAPDSTSRMEFLLPDDYSALVSTLKSAKLKHIHVHHTLHMPENMTETLANLATDLGVRYDYTAHDYLTICPRFTLYQDGTGGYCGEPDVKGCAGCLATYGSDYGKDVNMPLWREAHEKFLNNARKVFTPDDDVTMRLKKYFPKADIQSRPHEEAFDSQEYCGKERVDGDELSVVILGAIAPHKGASIIYDCAKDALDRKINIHFTVMGYTAEDWKRKPYSNMTITGGYKEEQLAQWLKDGVFHLAFFPAVWPETYSYTLSLAMRFGIHPVSFDLGAIGRRIMASGFGTVLPYRDFRSPQRINDALLAIRPQSPPEGLIQKNFSRYKNYINDYYELPRLD